VKVEYRLVARNVPTTIPDSAVFLSVSKEVYENIRGGNSELVVDWQDGVTFDGRKLLNVNESEMMRRRSERGGNQKNDGVEEERRTRNLIVRRRIRRI
jgi:hypothetical protein